MCAAVLECGGSAEWSGFASQEDPIPAALSNPPSVQQVTKTYNSIHLDSKQTRRHTTMSMSQYQSVRSHTYTCIHAFCGVLRDSLCVFFSSFCFPVSDTGPRSPGFRCTPIPSSRCSKTFARLCDLLPSCSQDPTPLHSFWKRCERHSFFFHCETPSRRHSLWFV